MQGLSTAHKGDLEGRDCELGEVVYIAYCGGRGGGGGSAATCGSSVWINEHIPRA